MQLKFGVVVGSSWGTLPKDLQLAWGQLDCDGHVARGRGKPPPQEPARAAAQSVFGPVLSSLGLSAGGTTGSQGSPGSSAVAANANFACAQDESPVDIGCQLRCHSGSCARAQAVCATIPQCVKVDVNRDKTWATLKAVGGVRDPYATYASDLRAALASRTDRLTRRDPTGADGRVVVALCVSSTTRNVKSVDTLQQVRRTTVPLLQRRTAVAPAARQRRHRVRLPPAPYSLLTWHA